MKRFLKEPGNADSYEGLTIKWIRGRNPDLYLYDDQGKVTETIDLSSLSTKAIHQLMLDKGFVKKVKQF